MSFMEPQFYVGEYVECSDPVDRGASFYEPAADWESEHGEIIGRHTGALFRLSAPGYMDRTEWTPAGDTEQDARRAFAEREESCPDCGECFQGHTFDDAAGNWAKLYPIDPERCPECDSFLPGYDALEDGIREFLGEGRERDARRAWAILSGHGEDAPEYVRAVERVRGSPAEPFVRLSAVDEIIGSGGVESLTTAAGSVVTYCNTGDPYRLTVLHTNRGRNVEPSDATDGYAVGTVGDIVEQEG